MSDTAQTSAETEPQTEPEVKAGSRESLLARSGKLREDTVTVDGETYLVRSLSGSARNKVIAAQAAASLKGTVDIDSYQRELLYGGLADPDSPERARKPLLERNDLDLVMGVGADFLDPIIERIEQLSGLSVDSEAAAKAFLARTDTPNTGSTPG